MFQAVQMALPASLATNRPLKLGDTFLGTGGDEGYYNLKLDFQPESLQQAQQADLLLLGEDKVCVSVGSNPRH